VARPGCGSRIRSPKNLLEKIENPILFKPLTKDLKYTASARGEAMNFADWWVWLSVGGAAVFGLAAAYAVYLLVR